MRTFVPATDDEIYALIEGFGFSALVAYRPEFKCEHRQKDLHERRPDPPVHAEPGLPPARAA